MKYTFNQNLSYSSQDEKQIDIVMGYFTSSEIYWSTLLWSTLDKTTMNYSYQYYNGETKMFSLLW